MKKTVLIGLGSFLAIYLFLIMIGYHNVLFPFLQIGIDAETCITCKTEAIIFSVLMATILALIHRYYLIWRDRDNVLKREALSSVEIVNTGILLLLAKLPLSDDRLGVILVDVLKLISSFPTLRVQAKGLIFMNEDKSLVLTASVGLNNSPVLELCRVVPAGKCLCGKMLDCEDQIKFTKNCSLRGGHDIQFAGMCKHGHLHVKIKNNKGEMLGLIALYTDIGYVRSHNDEQLLNAASNILASIIEKKLAEEKMMELSLFDILTGIPNRANFMTQKDIIISASERSGRPMSIWFIDLDKFKAINDDIRLGHDAGDDYLREVAKRGKEVFRRGNETFARIGGDEFSLIMPEVVSEDQVIALANKMIKAFNKVFYLKDIEMRIECSVGIYIGVGNGIGEYDAMKKADLSMYKAKKVLGGNIFSIWKD